jgi:hypothetical protein
VRIAGPDTLDDKTSATIERRGKMKDWIRLNKGFLLFLFLFGIFRTAVADWNPIPSGSMRPNLLEGDVVPRTITLPFGKVMLPIFNGKIMLPCSFAL